MILSMTGYGKSTIECKGKRFTAEIKSLNSKQMDLSIRIPQQFREFELPIRSIISQRLERGKVDVVISVETISADSTTTINQSAAAAYKLQIEELAKNLQIPLPQDWLSVLIKLPDVLKTDVSEIDDAEKDTLFSVVNNAIEGLVEFRTQEGNRLATFFEDKIRCIQESLEKLGDVDYDKNRFEQEMIFYIEKLDITEEKLRLQNHLDYFISTLNGNHGQGKKLGFISQEMGREINTMGSKANQAELQKVVVRMKDQLEQIKEQVLNVM